MKNIFLVGTILSVILVMTGCQSIGEPITIIETLEIEDVEEISIDVSSADVKIVKEKRNDILVEFDTYENGDKLKTEEGKKTKIETYSESGFDINIGGEYWLRIYIPEEFDEDFSIELSSGSLDLKDFELHNISCDLSSGDIEFTDVTANEINLELSSGDVKFSNVNTDLLTVDMSSGDVTLEDFTGEIKGESSSGTFYVKYKDTMDDLQFQASSGTIKIDYSKVAVDGTFDLFKSSGDIKINIELNEYNEKNDGDHIKAVSGSGKYEVELEISSGDIIIN